MPKVKLEIFIPESHLAELQRALQQSGAGSVGNYDSCMAYSRVTGTWRALDGANPYIGGINSIESAPELKVETFCDEERLSAALDAVKEIHPYDEPVIFVIPLMEQ